MKSLVRGTALAVCLAAACALAAIPSSTGFSARIADKSGPLQGLHTLVFKLFDVEAGGSQIWTETHPSRPVIDGLVSSELGLQSPLDANVITGKKLFLEVSVDGTVMSPRIAMVSVPYAVRADVAEVAAKLGNLSASDVVTGVSAGAGLSGGGIGGPLNLAVNFAGSGTAATVARSDHSHPYLPKGATLACTGTNKVTGIDATTGNLLCGADQSASYTAGAGLTLNGSTFAADMNVLQARVIGGCGVGSSIRSIAANGMFTCEIDTDTQYAAATGGGLLLAGNAFSIADNGIVSGKMNLTRGNLYGSVTLLNGVQYIYLNTARAMPTFGADCLVTLDARLTSTAGNGAGNASFNIAARSNAGNTNTYGYSANVVEANGFGGGSKTHVLSVAGNVEFAAYVYASGDFVGDALTVTGSYICF